MTESGERQPENLPYLCVYRYNLAGNNKLKEVHDLTFSCVINKKKTCFKQQKSFYLYEINNLNETTVVSQIIIQTIKIEIDPVDK